MKSSGNIFIGVGGWNSPPWRGVFYRKAWRRQGAVLRGLALTSIEINSTFYGSQKPESFRKWARETPDGFAFSVKGPRFTTNRRVLAEAGESITRFLNSGLMELGDRLGPCSGSFAPTKKFDPADFRAFLQLLPREARRPALAPRHRGAPRQLPPAGEFVALLREFNMAPPCYSEHETYPAHRRHHRRLRLSALAEGQGHDQDRLPAEGARCLGKAAADPLSAGRRPRRPSRRSIPKSAPKAKNRATCSPM